MTMQALQMGISAVQAGNKTEGARLLRIAIKSGELDNALKAIAYLWLAETSDDPPHKRACYSDALTADPNNADAKQRLAALLASQLPPPLPASAPLPPSALPEMTGMSTTSQRPSSAAYPIVGVIGGPNGLGTAFFVTPDGLLATTRYVVGGLERVTIELPGGRQIAGQVVRAFPEMDLTLVRAAEQVGSVLPVTPHPRVPDDARLTLVAYNGQQVRGKQRPTKRVMAQHWIPTDILKLADAGGNPILDERNTLVGMMTRNSSRASGYLFGVHIAAIRRCVEQYAQEAGSGERRMYCACCGSFSRAPANGYFYCDVCGAVAPQAKSLNRYPQGDAYFEASAIRCNHCGAQVGFYGGQCLRCGRAASAPVTI